MLKHFSRHDLVKEHSMHVSHPIMVMQYPSEDALNHKSRDDLASILHDSGHHSTAEAIENNAGFLRGTDPKEALAAYRVIEEHSAAITATLYYKGAMNDEISKLV